MDKMSWLFLLIAIISETVSTLALKASDGFKLLIPSMITITGFLGALFFLSQALKSMPVAIAYTVWSGLGIVLISLVGLFHFKEMLDIPAIFGIVLVISGVVVMSIFSKGTAH